MAGRYGSADVTVTIEDAPGGTARNVEDFLLNGISAKTLASMVETTGLGDADTEQTPAGIKSYEIATLEGIWDTTATTGSHAVLGTVDDGPQDDGRQVVITFGDSKTFTIDVRLMSYEVFAENNQIQRFRAELLPTGAGVWA
jgi:hypothetical protein